MRNPKNYSVLGSISAQLSKIQFTFRGTALSDRDARLMRVSLGYQYAMGCDLLPISQMHQYQSWLSTTQAIDVYSFGKFLANLDGHIKAYSSRYEHSCGSCQMDVASFKRSLTDCKGYWGFVSPIYPELGQFLLQPSSGSFRILNQWMNFIRRVNLRDINLEEDMESEYLEFELSMQDWTYNPVLLGKLNKIIKTWFGPFIPDADFIPKHGPGSIADHQGRMPIPYKYGNMRADMRLKYLEKYIGDMDSYVPIALAGPLSRVSEIVCVPKSMITNRTISKEPVSLQYFQQGVMRWIVDAVHSHPMLSRHISFTDQSLSSEMARVGSLWGDYATIDLSAASDSVSYDMVKEIFKGTWLLPFLVCTRSDKTRLPSGREVSLRKFAPMGSALCFPIETIVFAACCELAKQRSGTKARYRVFGDDIVISESAKDILVNILLDCHFEVNTTKSFGGTELLNFREACGGEFYNGVDVTPLRISRKFWVPDCLTIQSADHVSSYVSFANQAFDAGFLQLRYEILHDIRKLAPTWLADQLVYSCSGDIGIKSHPSSVTNYRLKSRGNTHLQLKEVFGFVPNSITRYKSCEECPVFTQQVPLGGLSCEDIRYFEWQRLYGYYREDEPYRELTLQICPVSSVMRGRWISTTML